MLCDGRRQISAFHLPGDVFGLTSAAEHRMSAEAVVGTTVRIVKRRALDAASRTDPILACALWTATADDLRHAEDHMMLLGRKSALEKLATFLLEMDRRLARSGFVALPMPRQDIADYIGLTIETVSRTVTQLQEEGALELSGARNIRLVDRQHVDGPQRLKRATGRRNLRLGMFAEGPGASRRPRIIGAGETPK